MANVHVNGGVVSNGVMLNSPNNMFVYSGGTANNTIVNEDAYIFVSSNGKVVGTVLNGGGELDLYSSGIASATVINSDGYMEAQGKAIGTVINDGGYLTVLSGGTASDTTVKTGGGLYVGENAMLRGSTVVEQGGWTTLDGGNAFTGIDVLGGNLVLSASTGDFCMVESINVNSNGSLTLANGVATVVTLSSAAATIKASGTLSSATLDSASVQILNGAELSRAIVNDGSIVTAASGARLQHITINRGGILTGALREASEIDFEGGTLAFDISGVAPNSDFLVDGISFTAINISENYFCTINVGRKQAYGAYTLVEDAAGFDNDKTVTVRDTAGGELGELALGSTTNLNGLYYTLWLNRTTYALTLTLSDKKDTAAPEVRDIKASTTEWTNRDVTVTASFTDDVEIYSKQYRIGNGAWQTYTDGVTVSENTTVYFQATDTMGNESEVVSYEVKNIDKIAPDAPIATANITTPTKQNVTVTATFPDDAAQRQYSRNGNAWTSYTTGVVMVENGNVRFRAIDAAGNISEVTTVKVANIEKSGPAKPIATADITAPTNKNVTLTVTYSSNSAKKQYSTDKKTWKDYQGAITVGKNETYYFRAINSTGRISDITTYTVKNIDKTAPAAPKVKSSNTKLTNKSITITATFSKDSDKKQYSSDNKTWQNYTKAVSIDKNGTYYFRAIDAAGNKSKVRSIKITNIDKTAPGAPKVNVSDTAPTNKNITLTATFSKDSAKKQYSTDKKNWRTYSKAITVTKNGTYYFRAIDAAGNKSKMKSIKVSNIDKTAPAAPKVSVSSTAPTDKSVTVTATFSNDSAKKQYTIDGGATWQDYNTKALTLKTNEIIVFRGVDAAGNQSKVKSVTVDNIMDKTNNTWENAEKAPEHIFAAVEKSFDKVDIYDLRGIENLTIAMERGTIKASFFDENHTAVDLDGQSSFTIAADSDPKKNSRFFDSISEEVKFLKIEAAANGTNSYRLNSALA